MKTAGIIIISEVKRYSRLFVFEGEKVEYTLGFLEMGENLLIGYSKLDRETKHIMVSKSNVEELFL